MTLHSLSPGSIKIHYDVTISGALLSHVMVVPVNLNLAGEGASSQLSTKSGTLILWTTYLNTFIALIKTQFGGPCTFTGAELFSQLDADSEPFFEDIAVLAVVGTHASQPVTASQTIMSFKSDKDGLLKLSMMEASNNINLRQNYTAMTAAQKAIADHILLSTASCIWARDNSYAKLFLHLTTKTNDKLRKHRFNL